MSPEDKVRDMNNNSLPYISLLWVICEYDKCKYFLILISTRASYRLFLADITAVHGIGSYQ